MQIVVQSAIRLGALAGCVAGIAMIGGDAAGDPHRPESHRAFLPVIRPKVPEVPGDARTNVDRFILAALEAKGFTLNPEADRATLIRRVSFDLTGLPP
ncbi:MAG TPA: DUF1549 domain-containing protein, partial [Gemmataceae bacterium]|nr:DUF1549 domain-containing protein [Gemmataceae bacterium]